jgi:dTDP-4-dehydrorhamnose 3,5-epimerase
MFLESRLPYHVTPTSLSGVLILEPKVLKDDRGFFYESFNQQDFAAATGLSPTFVQDNHSQSKKGVLRGLHYQIQHAQGKLVRVVKGEVYDVTVNLQRHHPEFGKWTGVHLSDQNHRQLWIPPGFAHGFLVLSHEADFLYKTTDYYSHPDERCLLWNDPAVSIEWPKDCAPILTDKDSRGSRLADADVYE